MPLEPNPSMSSLVRPGVGDGTAMLPGSGSSYGVLGVDPSDVGRVRRRRSRLVSFLSTQLPFDSLAGCETLLTFGDGRLVGTHRDVRIAESYCFSLRHLARRPQRSYGAFDCESVVAMQSSRRLRWARRASSGPANDFAHHTDLERPGPPTFARSCRGATAA